MGKRYRENNKMLSKEQTIPTKGKGSKLSTKMALFVEEYFVDFNASAACLRAGYKTKSPNKIATKLMNHPLVKQAIDKKKEERVQETQLTAEYVINKLVRIADRNEEANPNAALRSLELLGKHLGLYRDRQEISGPDGEAIHVKEEQIKRNAEEFTNKILQLSRRANGSLNLKSNTDEE
jgi:phage terminase small subunit